MLLTIRSFAFMSPIAFRSRKVFAAAPKASERMTMMNKIRAKETSNSTRVKPGRRRGFSDRFMGTSRRCYGPSRAPPRALVDNLDHVLHHDHHVDVVVLERLV